MPNYLVALYRPRAEESAFTVDATMAREIDALNDAMVAAGIRVFVGGLKPTNTAQSLHRQPDGNVTLADGPLGPAADYMDGFWVLKVANADEAVAWGRRAAAACRASVEVRPFH